MVQGAMVFLIVFPMLVAVALYMMKKPSPHRRYLIYSSAGIIAAAAIVMLAHYFADPAEYKQYFYSTHFIDILMLIGEVIICVIICWFSTKHGKHYISLMAVAQTGLIVWLEIGGRAEEVLPESHMFSDDLTALMTGIVGIVGALICVYAVKYMVAYNEHHATVKDRRYLFFALLFLFLGAMFGIVFSNNLIWMYFFWEITSLVSFLLIGYNQDEVAVNNAFRSLWMNTLGGLAFAAAIAYMVIKLESNYLTELITMIKMGNKVAVIPVALLAFAALTKSAQMPFSRWLLGAMVAPTPTSALLHSTTMVKAGVFLLIRLSPGFTGNEAGTMVMLIGGFTFFAASLLAISQSDAKKVLAYSTISNLGLICACAGVGIASAAWAAVMLILFHAVSKSLLFLTVGAIENNLYTRDIEDMHGLIIRLPNEAMILITGISAMFLAPFGMLIAKWASMKAFVDAGNILLIGFVVFGSASTLLYWAKWLGKTVSVVDHSHRIKSNTRTSEWVVLSLLTAVMLLLCLAFPFISDHLIYPYLVEVFGSPVPPLFTNASRTTVMILMIIVSFFPFIVRLLTARRKKGEEADHVLTVMGGANYGDNRHFINATGDPVRVHMSNWYIDSLFGEKKLLRPSLIAAAIIITACMILAIGGML